MDAVLDPILNDLKKLNAEQLYALNQAVRTLIKTKRRPTTKYSGKDCKIEFMSGHARLDKWASCFVSCRKWKIESINKIVDKGITETWVKGIALKKEGGAFWVYFTQGIGGNKFPQDSISVEFIAKPGANICFVPPNRNEVQKGYISGEIEVLRMLRGQAADKVIKLSKEGNKAMAGRDQKSGAKST